MSEFLISRFWLSTSLGRSWRLGLVASPEMKTKLLPGWVSPGDRAVPERSANGRTEMGTGRVVAEGCVVAYPGAEVVVGSEAAGRIATLNVREGSAVRKGDLIAALNADDLLASLAEAEAKTAEAEADARFFERETRRDEILVARRAAAVQDLDANRHSLETARARRAAGSA